MDLLKRTPSDVSDKVHLDALHAYYTERAQSMGVPIEIIARPEDAFMIGQQPRRVWGIEPWVPPEIQ